MKIISPQWMLLLGILLSFFLVNFSQVQNQAKKASTYLLQMSVIFLGASLNFHEVLKQGAKGLLITFLSLILVFGVGSFLSTYLQVEKKLGLLITMGTAICGGSAIGALAPVIMIDSIGLTISMGVVFLLNAVAVFLFPPIGEWMNLSQDQFGLWSALAIHDTSSVVAAAGIYGEQALKVATTIKLTRALWIIPVTLLFSFIYSRKTKSKLSFPYFILGFVAFSILFTFIDQLHSYQGVFLMISKTGFSFTLFLIGLSFSWQKLRQVGPRPLVFGVGLWAMVVAGSLAFVSLNAKAATNEEILAHLRSAQAGKEVLVDVREKSEVEAGMISFAKWFPLSTTELDPDWYLKFKTIAGDKKVLLYCRSGHRAGIMQKKLGNFHVDSVNLGGYEDLVRLLNGNK